MKNDIFEYTDEEGRGLFRMLFAETDIVLYAVWGEGIPVTFDANGGYFLDSDDNEVTSIVRYTAPGEYPDEPYPGIYDESRMFDGWSTAEDGTIEDISNVTEPITYFAIWKNAYTITLDAGEGYFEYWDGDDEYELITEKRSPSEVQKALVLGGGYRRLFR